MHLPMIYCLNFIIMYHCVSGFSRQRIQKQLVARRKSRAQNFNDVDFKWILWWGKKKKPSTMGFEPWSLWAVVRVHQCSPNPCVRMHPYLTSIIIFHLRHSGIFEREAFGTPSYLTLWDSFGSLNAKKVLNFSHT